MGIVFDYFLIDYLVYLDNYCYLKKLIKHRFNFASP